MPATLEVGLVALNERYDDDDPRWRDQVADLVHELRRETESVQSRRAPVPGTKGTVDQLILALGSAGAFTAAVDVVRAWLARDKHRLVEMTVTDADGRTHTVRVSAENASADALAPLISAASTLAQER
jgi:exopolyphosphatase/pppGpp-phosphohydrolase